MGLRRMHNKKLKWRKNKNVGNEISFQTITIIVFLHKATRVVSMIETHILFYDIFLKHFKRRQISFQRICSYEKCSLIDDEQIFEKCKF